MFLSFVWLFTCNVPSCILFHNFVTYCPQLGPGGDISIKRTKKGELSINAANVDFEGGIRADAVKTDAITASTIKTGSISVDGESLESIVKRLVAAALGNKPPSKPAPKPKGAFLLQ